MLQVSLNYGPLHYRYVEKEKLTGSKSNQGNLSGKLDYLLKQKLRYNGGLIILTIHVTIRTYLILTSLYMLMLVSQVGVSPDGTFLFSGL